MQLPASSEYTSAAMPEHYSPGERVAGKNSAANYTVYLLLTELILGPEQSISKSLNNTKQLKLFIKATKVLISLNC